MGLNELPTEKIDPWLVTWDYGGKSLEVIKEYADIVDFPAGATIFSIGDSSDAMYLVLEGMILVLVRDDRGKEQTVSIITEGQSFGEIGLLINQPRLATTAAGIDTKLLRITADTLETLENEHPSTIINLYKILAKTLAAQWILASGETPMK